MVSRPRIAALLIGIVCASNARATTSNAADDSIRQFLAQGDTQRGYRAVRRLEAENRDRKGWLEAMTEYAPPTGFRYQITAEGGSEYIHRKVLRAVLEGEREIVAQGEMGRSSLDVANYRFQANGVDGDGLANVVLSPRRRERVLVVGTMFLEPSDGTLVRLQGRLAKSPSWWVKHVDVLRTYERIDGAVVPVALETKADVRFVGEAALRVTYTHSEIDGRPLSLSASLTPAPVSTVARVPDVGSCLDSDRPTRRRVGQMPRAAGVESTIVCQASEVGGELCP